MTMTDSTTQTRRRPTVHLLHGIAVRGDGRIAKLKPALEAAGFDVQVHSYGFTWLFTVRRRNERISEDLAEVLEDGDIIIGHSNGCVIAHRACSLNTHPDGAHNLGLIHINPALPTWATPPTTVSHCHVFYSPSDGAVGWASLARRFWPLSWFRETLWGAMGRDGYAGTDERVTQTNLDAWFRRELGHSGVFASRYRPALADRVAGIALRWRRQAQEVQA